MKQAKDEAFERHETDDKTDDFEKIVRKLRSCKTKASYNTSTAQKIVVDSDCLEIYMSDDGKVNTVSENSCKENRKNKCKENQDSTAFDLAKSSDIWYLKNRSSKRNSLEVIGTAMKIYTNNIDVVENEGHSKRILRSAAVKAEPIEIRDKSVKRKQASDKDGSPVSLPVSARMTRRRTEADPGKCTELQQLCDGRESNEVFWMKLRNSSNERKPVKSHNRSRETQQDFTKRNVQMESLKNALRSSKKHRSEVNYKSEISCSKISCSNIVHKPLAYVKDENSREIESALKSKKSHLQRNLFEAMGQAVKFQQCVEDGSKETIPRILRSSNKKFLEDRSGAVKIEKPIGDKTSSSLSIYEKMRCPSRKKELLGVLERSAKINVIDEGMAAGCYYNPGDLPVKNVSNGLEAKRKQAVANCLSTKGNGLSASKEVSKSLSHLRRSPRLHKSLEKLIFSQLRSCTSLKNAETRRNLSLKSEVFCSLERIKCDDAMGDSQGSRKKIIYREKTPNANNSCKDKSRRKQDECQISLKYKSAKTLQVCRKNKKKRLDYWDLRLEKILTHIRSQDYHRIIGIIKKFGWRKFSSQFDLQLFGLFNYFFFLQTFFHGICFNCPSVNSL